MGIKFSESRGGFVSLRMDLERLETEKGINENLVDGTRKLDQILNSQRSLEEKTSLRYSRLLESSMRKMNSRSAGFQEPQNHANMHQERTIEDRNVLSQR